MTRSPRSATTTDRTSVTARSLSTHSADKWRSAEGGKPGSVTDLRPAEVISLGRRLPDASCSLPGARMGRAAPRSCLALLPVGFVVPRPFPARAVGSYPTVSPLPVRAAEAVRHRRSILCDTFRRLATPGRYPAPCPLEPGLSSSRASRPARDLIPLRSSSPSIHSRADLCLRGGGTSPRETRLCRSPLPQVRPKRPGGGACSLRRTPEP